MAVMLRSVGIPSRLCTGYLPDEWDPATGSSALQAKNRHAWLEVYFPGYGWIEFEATPNIDREIGVTPLEDSEEEKYWEEWDEQYYLGLEDETAGTSDGGTTSQNQSRSITPLIIIGIIVLTFILWLVISRWLRRFRSPDLASEIYRKMCFLASLARLSPKSQQTPLEYCSGLALAFPRHTEALDSIVRAYIERRFGVRSELEPREKGMLRKSWHQVYLVLLKRLFYIKY